MCVCVVTYLRKQTCKIPINNHISTGFSIDHTLPMRIPIRTISAGFGLERQNRNYIGYTDPVLLNQYLSYRTSSASSPLAPCNSCRWGRHRPGTSPWTAGRIDYATARPPIVLLVCVHRMAGREAGKQQATFGQHRYITREHAGRICRWIE